MFKLGIYVLNYLADLVSDKTVQHAEFAYKTLQTVLQKCGIEDAKNKACPLSTPMTFAGVVFNSETMTIEITSARLQEIIFF